MRFLNLCDPSLYRQPSMDVPTLYQYFARDPRIDFFHVPLDAVRQADQISVVPVSETLTYRDFLQLDEQPRIQQSLSNFDLVFCRRLKPFPDGYLEQLANWSQFVRFINDPIGKMEQMQPDFLQRVARDYIPETLVTSSVAAATAFFEQHQAIVAKRANSCGGRGIFKIWPESQSIWVDNSMTGKHRFQNFAQAMQYIQGEERTSLQFVRYLNNVTVGDKRIVVVDGEIYGAYLRRSKSGHWVNNVSVDGACELAEITDAEREAIEQTVGHYRDRGLHTLGYDFLLNDDGIWRISEINAGNIGGFARLEALTGERVCDRFINWLLDFAQTQPHSKAVHACIG